MNPPISYSTLNSFQLCYEGNCLLKEPIEEIKRFEYAENEKVLGYMEVSFVTDSYKGATALRDVFMKKGSCYKKYAKELVAKINEYLQGKIVDMYGIENIQIGTFYCGEFRKWGEVLQPERRLREITVMEGDLPIGFKFNNEYIYFFQHRLFEKVDISAFGSTKDSIDFIRQDLQRNGKVFMNESKADVFYFISKNFVYIQSGIIDPSFIDKIKAS